MPIVTIGLDDKVLNAKVNNEFWFDEKGVIKAHSNLCQHLAQLDFEFAWLIPLQLLVPLEKTFHYLGDFVGMILSPIFNLGNYFWSLHRIMICHVLTGSGVDDAPPRFFCEAQVKFVGFVSHLYWRSVKMLGNKSGTIRRIMLTKIHNFFFCPPSQAFAAELSLVRIILTATLAVGAGFLSCLLADSVIVDIAATDGAKPFDVIFSSLCCFSNGVATYSAWPITVSLFVCHWLSVLVSLQWYAGIIHQYTGSVK